LHELLCLNYFVGPLYILFYFRIGSSSFLCKMNLLVLLWFFFKLRFLIWNRWISWRINLSTTWGHKISMNWLSGLSFEINFIVLWLSPLYKSIIVSLQILTRLVDLWTKRNTLIFHYLHLFLSYKSFIAPS